MILVRWYRAALAVLFPIALAVLAGCNAQDAKSARPLAKVQLSRVQSRGFVLRSWRVSFGLTQAQLAALSAVPARTVSRLERGLDSGSTGQEDALATVLDSVQRARLHPDTEPWLVQLTRRIRTP